MASAYPCKSEYELQREADIRKNEETLRQLRLSAEPVHRPTPNTVRKCEMAMESRLAVTGRPSAAASPMLDPGAVDDVQLLRVETAADRTAAAKRAATALDDGESPQRQEARPSQAAAAHSIRDQRADHLAFAWVTHAVRDAEIERWKVTCRIQVPFELSQRRCHWQRADPPIAGQEVQLVPGAARSGLGWARCKTNAIEKIGLPWEQEFKGIKDGDHLFCVQVKDELDEVRVAAEERAAAAEERARTMEAALDEAKQRSYQVLVQY